MRFFPPLLAPAVGASGIGVTGFAPNLRGFACRERPAAGAAA